MADFTKKEIKKSFIKLLENDELKNITVKDITKDCDINRNTFYYHYEDIPTLLEDIFRNEIDTIVEENKNTKSLSNTIEIVGNYILKNKRVILHIYNSLNKDALINALNKLSSYVSATYVNKVLEINDEETKEVLTNYFKFVIYGFIIDWLNSSLKQENIQKIQQYLIKYEDDINIIKETFLKKLSK